MLHVGYSLAAAARLCMVPPSPPEPQPTQPFPLHTATPEHGHLVLPPIKYPKLLLPPIKYPTLPLPRINCPNCASPRRR